MSTWIKAADQLPDENGRYAVVYKQGSTVKAFTADYDDFYGWNCKLPSVEIVYWLKLPPIPNA